MHYIAPYKLVFKEREIPSTPWEYSYGILEGFYMRWAVFLPVFPDFYSTKSSQSTAPGEARVYTPRSVDEVDMWADVVTSSDCGCPVVSSSSKPYDARHVPFILEAWPGSPGLTWAGVAGQCGLDGVIEN